MEFEITFQTVSLNQQTLTAAGSNDLFCQKQDHLFTSCICNIHFCDKSEYMICKILKENQRIWFISEKKKGEKML